MEIEGLTIESEMEGYASVIEIYKEGEEDSDPEFTWNDSIHMDAPEDLTWGRNIGRVFRKGFELGREVERKQQSDKGDDDNA
jgi:hypothetical protein